MEQTCDYIDTLYSLHKKFLKMNQLNVRLCMFTHHCCCCQRILAFTWTVQLSITLPNYSVNFIGLHAKDLISICYQYQYYFHLLCLRLMNLIMLNSRSLILTGLTHHALSAPFIDSHKRSALFNIFRAVALPETQSKENHCCYGNGERVSGGGGTLWQKTRPDLTMPAPIGPQCNDDVFWHHAALKTFIHGLVPETLYSQCPVRRLNVAKIYTVRHRIQGDMTACTK